MRLSFFRRPATARGTHNYAPPAPPGRRSLRLFAAVAVSSLVAATGSLLVLPAQAAVAGVGAVDPSNGFPTWYSDGVSKLKFCVDPADGCLAAPPNPDAPISFPDNFADEAFWYSARAAGGNLRDYRAELEGAFANTVTDGDQMGFARLRFILTNMAPGATYTIQHPYGVKTISSTTPDPNNPGRAWFKETIDSGSCAPTLARPCDWAAVGDAFLGDYAVGSTATFLKQVGAPAGTLGSIATEAKVTGAPSGINAVIVTGPDAGGPGINTLTVSNFTVQGVLFNGADAAPTTPDLAAASDTGRSSTDNITNDATPTLTGTVPGVTSPTTVEYLVDGVLDTTSTGQTNDLGVYSVTLPALTSASHRVQARVVNPAFGGTDPAAPQFLVSGTLSFTVDTVAPVTTVNSPRPSNPTLNNVPTLNFSSTDPTASFQCGLSPSNPGPDPCVSPLTYDAQADGNYTFTATGTDPAGNVGAPASYAWRIGQADTIAPTVTGRTPASGATGQAVASKVTATFSEALAAGSVSGATFTLKNAAGTTISSSVAYDTATRIATLTPTASLAFGTTYTATLSGGTAAIRDVSNNPLASTSWSFTTVAAPDTTAPTATTSPAANATAVSPTGNITATFSENTTGVSGTTFTLKNAAGTSVAAVVTYNATTRVATLDPTATLANSTTYTATLTGGAAAIRDTANNALVTKTWSFTTAAAGDVTRPTISARTPGVNGTAASTTGNITATFSENVNGVSGTTFTLKNAAGAAIPAVVSYSSTTRVATLNPNSTLAADTKYTATLTGGATAVRDAVGNTLATSSWTFLTGAAPTVTIAPAANATGVSVSGNITGTFSENVAGISGTSFTLKNAAGTAIPAVVSYNATTRVATLNPNANLAADQKYTVTLTGSATAIRDTAGNPLATRTWTFLAGTRPTVTARTPAVNALGVSRTANQTATFSENVTGVSATTATLKNATTGAAITAVVTYNATTRVVTINPSATLPANTKFTVTLTGGTTAIRDTAGNTLTTVTWSFTTGA